MKQIIFICHGNICRSTMAEFLFREMVKQAGRADEFLISSRATSTEELGNPVHPGTRRVLSALGIDCSEKRAQRITGKECGEADYLIVMDENNRRNLLPFLERGEERKVSSLLSWAGLSRDISDPWYTGNFDETYKDVKLGCEALWKALS